ncbi:MAG: hypothetical protein ABFE13_20600 [Phycisphaerales bacterium]
MHKRPSDPAACLAAVLAYAASVCPACFGFAVGERRGYNDLDDTENDVMEDSGVVTAA